MSSTPGWLSAQVYPNDFSTFFPTTKSVECPTYMGLVGETKYWDEEQCETADERIYSAEGEEDEDAEQHELQIALALSKEDPLVEELATRCNDFDTTPVSTDTVCFILFSCNNIVSEIIPLSSILQICLQGSWHFFFHNLLPLALEDYIIVLSVPFSFALSLTYVNWKLLLGSNLVRMIINFMASNHPS